MTAVVASRAEVRRGRCSTRTGMPRKTRKDPSPGRHRPTRFADADSYKESRKASNASRSDGGSPPKPFTAICASPPWRRIASS